MPVIPPVEHTNRDRIYNLLVELQQVKTAKKETVKTANDEVKRVQAEIDELMEREEEAKLDAILGAQMADVEKRARAHFVVDTGQGLDHARDQVRDIVAALRERAETPQG